MVPCKECIVFPKCRLKKEVISCPILYKYFVGDGIKFEFRPQEDRQFYADVHMDRLSKIVEFFGHQLHHWHLSTEVVYKYDTDPPELLIYWWNK